MSYPIFFRSVSPIDRTNPLKGLDASWVWHDDSFQPAEATGFSSREEAVNDWYLSKQIQTIEEELAALDQLTIPEHLPMAV